MDIYYSQQGEDLFIYRNFINKNDNKDGIFLELGACDGHVYSNTKFFEDKLNFKGILIEPEKEIIMKIISSMLVKNKTIKLRNTRKIKNYK